MQESRCCSKIHEIYIFCLRVNPSAYSSSIESKSQLILEETEIQDLKFQTSCKQIQQLKLEFHLQLVHLQWCYENAHKKWQNPHGVAEKEYENAKIKGSHHNGYLQQISFLNASQKSSIWVNNIIL